MAYKEILVREISLSICIPTYNRPQQFAHLLALLLPQLTVDIELVVRDDSDDDESRNIFNEYISKYNFSYKYFQGEKIGLDEANLFLLEMATGKFVWWFSDDDELLDGGVNRVLSIISADPQVGYIFANFAFQELGNLAVERGEGYFQDPDEVLISLGTNIGLLSTYILNKEIALRGIKFGRKHCHGFSFALTAVLLYVVTHSQRQYFLRGPYILCNPTTIEEIKRIAIRSNEQIVNNAFDTYGIFFHDVIMEFRHLFSRNARRIILSKNFSALWRGMAVGWVGGWDEPKGKRLKMLKLYWSFPECWFALAIFFMPLSVNQSLYRFYKIFYSHRKLRFFNKV